MTERIAQMLEEVRQRDFRKYRREVEFSPVEALAAQGLSPAKRTALRLVEVLNAETPRVFRDEKIAYVRTVKNLPPVFTQTEWEEMKANHFIHEQGVVCNICADYERVMQGGLLAERLKCVTLLKNAAPEQAEMLNCSLMTIDSVLELADRYRAEAERIGNLEVAYTLAQVPARGARTFREALQMFRILHYTLWCEGEYHNTVGRFDQFAYPYFKVDLESGKLDRNSALELVEEFFLTFNRDSELYPGIQQGDNGQSMMLGGVNENGEESFNLLSELCLEASRELKLIDPKINLRVSSKTPLRVFELGSKLTKEGLGFPQYSNDDIVIDALVKRGYSLKDARNYTVAACWEFIVPKVGMDIPNIGAINFPQIINNCATNSLKSSADFQEFFNGVCARLRQECSTLNDKITRIYMCPAPFLSVLMEGCLEAGKDISQGSTYNNFGFHGVGISTAVDSLASIEKFIFEDKSIKAAELCDALQNGFEEKDDLFAKLRFEGPKFGDDDDGVNLLARRLMDAFGDATDNLVNERGGCIRAGTGSAMFYLWYADNIGCAASGHTKGEAFSANYSPELFVKNRGPLSVIRSFTQPDLKRVCNGGPLTMEFHSTVFQHEEGVRKVAMLVKNFIDAGGHQLQLNSVSRNTLLDAQHQPENYQNLIVRVWGWSAYFVELDKEYQNHVISRQEYSI